ncbi:hypothetical protein SPRG_12572 [Saprolegnia parasitica CBS 223.65]|uniref:RING-type domain-containing protein n=1 Tax=Saprolegnia parasitica (strain CBS 223.65) TaxID=695850 RepID=A0A067C717_SAPPC|nr:hypothetical protein SPRG_12572 [Saprolegnia parasitica CBS 223.65]KDO22592.1 hypothetical protein SPRG_12572 [Saprolegnia parasitica CBS 223.65]|eukprot:XP_012206708.1 hypothetical protein SPRG_12572 [Saprolegnia parasitica CBS 223.65]
MNITSLCHDLAAHEHDASIERLKTAHEHDMKQVKVHSSAMNVAFHGSGPFTIYTMIVTCPGTKTWWVLKKRYSQFFSVRKQLLRHLKACNNSRFAALADILAPALEMDFPKKHMLVSIDNKAVIKERKTQFQRFTAALIALRASCILASLDADRTDAQLAKLDAVFDLLQEFLEIPSTHDPLAGSSPTSDRCSETSNDSSCDSCSICLNDFQASGATYHYQTPKHNAAPAKKVRFALDDDDDDAKAADEEETVLKLPCNHYFHEECVMYWIEQKNSCPLCRADAFEGVMV